MAKTTSTSANRRTLRFVAMVILDLTESSVSRAEIVCGPRDQANGVERHELASGQFEYGHPAHTSST